MSIQTTLLIILLVTGAADALHSEEQLQLQQNGTLADFRLPAERGWATPIFVYPQQFSGSRPEDYIYQSSDLGGMGKAWIQAKTGAVQDLNAYAALSQVIPAQDFWGDRIQFRADVAMNGVRSGAFGVLFVRVVSSNGITLAFDNMKGRGMVAWIRTYRWLHVVLDIPGPPDGVCPTDGAADLPAWIYAGFLLCGGRGYMQVSAATLEVVGPDLQVTGGPPPWEDPGM